MTSGGLSPVRQGKESTSRYVVLNFLRKFLFASLSPLYEVSKVLSNSGLFGVL